MTLEHQADRIEANVNQVAETSMKLAAAQAEFFTAVTQQNAPAAVAASKRVREHVREMGRLFADYHESMEQIEATLSVLCPK